MRFFILLICFIGFFSANAQTVTQMEAQYAKTTDKSQKMNLAAQLADKFLSTNPAKAIKYANETYNLANEAGNSGFKAKAAYIIGFAALKKNDLSTAKSRFDKAKDFALDAGNTDLAMNCYDQLTALAKRERNYELAYKYNQESLDLLRGSGSSTASSKSTSSGSSDNSALKDRNRLLREKEQWTADRQELMITIQNLKRDLESLRNEKQQFATKEKKIVEESEQALSAKEIMLQNIAKEKTKAESAIKERERLLKSLTKESLADSLMLAKKENELTEAELRVEASNRWRDLLIAICLGILALSALLYKRFVDNRKSKRVLEEKNKIIEHERERSDELLLNILPAPIAMELKENGKAQARYYESATVLFTDFLNFTQIAEQLKPEDLVKELDDCFKAFDFITAQYGLEKIKTIGDSYMCASGLSDSHHSPTNVVRAAIEMQEFLSDHRKEKIAEGKPYFEARIGINTGPVVAGVVGVKKFAYDIWGDTVNIASRMETNCEPNKINISETTYWQIKYEFNCAYRGKIAVKNKGNIDMYYVNGKA